MEKTRKKILSMIAVITVLLTMLSITTFAADTKSVSDNCAEWLKNNIDTSTEYNGSIDWATFALKRGGYSGYKDYIDFINSKVKKDYTKLKLSDYARIAIAVNSAGGDATDVGGKDLIKAIKSYDFSKETSTSTVANTILALESKDYNADKTVNTLISMLLAGGVQRPDGGFGYEFALGEYSKKGDIDCTAMVLQAFAKHKSESNVSASINKALAFLKSSQLKSGAFGLYGASAESTAQVLIALCMLDINPVSPDFTKGGNTIVTALCSFQDEDGAMKSADGSLNVITTYQALSALDEYSRYQNNEKSIFDMSKTKDEATANDSKDVLPSKADSTWKKVRVVLIIILAVVCIGEIIFMTVRKRKAN